MDQANMMPRASPDKEGTPKAEVINPEFSEEQP
jgi:hypothetical protein